MAGSRRQYPFHLIELKWQQTWEDQQAFRAFNPGDSVPADHPFGLRHGCAGQKPAAAQLPPKFYILDMFPYPSGAGLHVGHPEGYTATDILARYRRACGFNVLHPMGWDSFGLPAEQYAVKTGQHPRVTTEANIANFTRQIKSLGFSYDWTRELATTDPDYFKWTQWIFLKLYNSWFNPETNKAEPIETLKYAAELEQRASARPAGSSNQVSSAAGTDGSTLESAAREYRDSKRLAYVSEAPVNWCPELGTVLANEEVIDGKSEVGGFPVIRKPMRQWMLRITAYAEKLLADLDTIDWSDSLKEMQRNWIGRSEGAEVDFKIADCALGLANKESSLRVFTTRPDTLFGATYMVLAPEHKLVDSLLRFAKESFPANGKISAKLATVFDVEGKTLGIKPFAEALEIARGRGADLIQLSSIGEMAVCIVQDYGAFRFAQQEAAKQVAAVVRYREEVAKKSDLERTELAKEKTGVFTGAYALNPVNGEKIPIWIADYVLASYGTGAIMAVPAHDLRDFEFAEKFGLKVITVVEPDKSIGHHAGPTGCFAGDGFAVNSNFLDGLPTAEAKEKITAWLEEKGLAKKTINYKLRDWLFSRQRYWGEPFPIIWKKDAAGNLYHEALPESSLPLLPPSLEDYKPTPDGQPPLARAKDWLNLPDGSVRETNTMPQWAGSCWYYLRYLDARRSESFCGTLAEHYWMGASTSGLLLTDDQWRSRLAELFSHPVENSSKRYVTFAVVGDDEAARLKIATGLDLKGCRRFIDAQAVRHILTEHGDEKIEAARGQLGVTREDIALIPLIVTNPDHVKHAGQTRRHLDAVFYEKRINGFLCCVEEVREGAGLLAVKTLYKRKTTGAHAVTGLDQTSEAFRRSESNKPDPSDIVKPTPGVDLYVGGTEHAVLHLLYARFWHKVLFDLGYVSTPEPFFKLVNQGLILGEDGQKMSKSRGNVVNPDDVLMEFGADAFRLYEMFMGPLQDTKPWNTRGVEGVYRFLGRVWRLFVDEQSETEFEQAETTTKEQSNQSLLDLIKLHAAIKDVSPTPAQLKTLHACIKKVTEDLDGMRFNTAISAMMVFVNDAMTWETKPVSALRIFLQLLHPFAPHIAEELWSKVSSLKSNVPATPGATTTSTSDFRPQTLDSLPYAPWPKFDPALLIEDILEIPVQVNGKLRDVIKVSATATPAELEAAALANDKVKPFLDGKTIRKIIVVPKKLVNIVAG